MTFYSEVSLEGKKTNYKLEMFTFKLDKIKNAMIFGKKRVTLKMVKYP